MKNNNPYSLIQEMCQGGKGLKNIDNEVYNKDNL